jgi:PAS domain S-box-containing protein
VSIHDASEAARLAALDAFAILDTPPEDSFDEVAQLAAEICDMPIAVVNLIGEGRQFFKAEVGLGVRSTPLETSFCAKALLEEEFLVVPDATKDPRFDCNPLVTGDPNLRFYAGALLRTGEGHAIGTVCVLDFQPRTLSPTQERTLRVLARQVMKQLELRRAIIERDATTERAQEADVLHRQILDSATDYAIITSSLDGSVTSWNTGAENVLGWSEPEVLGKPTDIFFTAEDVAARIPDAERASARERGRGNDERWHIRKDGSRFYALGEMMPLTSAGGAHVGYLKILRDRTQQREAEALSAQTQRALAVSEERYRALFQAIDDGFCIIEFCDGPHGPLSDYVHVEANPGYGRQSGIEGIVGKTVREVAPDEADGWVQIFREVLRTGEPIRCERLFEVAGRHIEVSAARIEPASRRQVSVLFRDIEERKRAEAALRASEERYRLVTRATNDAIWDWDLVGDHILWNEALGTAYGYDVTQIGPSGAWWLDKIHPDDRAGVETDIRATIAGSMSEWSHEYRFRRADGTYADVLDRGYMVRGPRGEPVRMIGAMLDLSERKRDERRLREMNAVLEERVEERTRERDRSWRNTQDIQVIIDGAGIFKAVNPAFTTILGWTPQDVLGHPVFAFVLPDDEAVTDQALQHARVESLPIVENRFCHKDGGFRWISWVAAPEGELIYASGRHITAEKEQAEALKHTEEALRQAQKMEAVGQLTGGLAHDFNNLLAGISGSLELMQTRMSQGRLTELDRYMTAAQGATKRAAALTHRLLAFSRRQTLDPRPTDVNRLVTGMEDLVRRTIGPAIELEVVGAGGLWATLVDPPQLENALLNLCINARDAMPDGGRLTIETCNRWLDRRAAAERDLPPGQYVSLCVSDTGSGMTPDVIAKAFDPFFTTKPIGQGTGLGLSMIYGFARQSGGQVRIYSEPGEGSMLCIYLPRLIGAAEAGEVVPELAAAPRAQDGETVLVVDDEPTVRMLVTEVLQELGYAAIEAADGPSGLRVLQSDARIDLLVTDVGLPGGMNGRQMADAARVSRSDLKVLFITGYAENAAVGNGHLEAGMQVLTKPFAMEALASRIKEMIKRG